MATSTSDVSRLWRVVDATLWIVVVLGSVAAAVAVHVGGIQVTRVLSASMVPTFQPGDIAVVRAVGAMDLAVGDIPVLPDPDEPRFQVAHRIVALERVPERGEVRVVTQGDANPATDAPVTIVSEQVPEIVLRLPVGQLDLARVTWTGSLWVLGGSVAAFLLLLVVPRRRARDGSDP